jgi:cell fate regulator YaaT (PSP1 superfamily)
MESRALTVSLEKVKLIFFVFLSIMAIVRKDVCLTGQVGGTNKILKKVFGNARRYAVTYEENLSFEEAEEESNAPNFFDDDDYADLALQPLLEKNEETDPDRVSSDREAWDALAVHTSLTEHPDIACAGSTSEHGPRFFGIRLRKTGQVFFFSDEEHTVRIGSKVIVELEHGSALGEIDSINYGIAPPLMKEDGTQVIGKVVRLATAQDIALHTENSSLCAEASAFCKSCIRQRKLDMKLVDVEVLHDRSKIIFYFTAPARIDFRELVKDLVRNYRTRIELRQIGVRHETQMVGGIGNCGMVCCCHKYLRKFAPVTIKMAKEQNLFLNPAKLSGMCGRLLCCLSFEQGNYEEFNRRCPKLGKKYTTDSGTVKVLRTNMFNQSIVVLSEGGEEKNLTLEEWDTLHARRVEFPAPDQQCVTPLRNGVSEGASEWEGSRGHDHNPAFEEEVETALDDLLDKESL